MQPLWKERMTLPKRGTHGKGWDLQNRQSTITPYIAAMSATHSHRTYDVYKGPENCIDKWVQCHHTACWWGCSIIVQPSSRHIGQAKWLPKPSEDSLPLRLLTPRPRLTHTTKSPQMLTRVLWTSPQTISINHRPRPRALILAMGSFDSTSKRMASKSSWSGARVRRLVWSARPTSSSSHYSRYTRLPPVRFDALESDPLTVDVHVDGYRPH